MAIAPGSAEIALNRFGLGARSGELRPVGRDPRGWLTSQLSLDRDADEGSTSLPTSADALARFFEMKELRKSAASVDPKVVPDFSLQRELFRNEVAAHVKIAVTTDKPFQERLVWFWANHFTVSAQNKVIVLPAAGAFVREAIRPHVLGSFGDMLRAVEQHPATLLYLDNAQSVGPESFGGRLRDKGLNENLAREVLELHTVGVDAGYTQADVTSFAKILTGWSIVGPRARQGDKGTFRYDPRIHEPGPQTVLGKTYRDNGLAQGQAVLDDLAHHSATAHHLAVKLARHFVADDPPPSVVARVAETYRRHGGALKPVYEALVADNESWATPLTKLKTPEEFLVSILRGLNVTDVDKLKSPEILTVMGQRPFFAPSPQGWPDQAAAWAGPEAIKVRLDYANQVALRAGSRVDATVLAADILGSNLQSRTRESLTRASSPVQAMTLLLMSPEFQRR